MPSEKEHIIPFRKNFISGKEQEYIFQALTSNHLSGDGAFTVKCQEFIQKKYNFGSCLFTTSGSSALELAALVANIQPGDEVILPSFTFVATANAFALRGAKLVFVDSMAHFPEANLEEVKQKLTAKTKAVVWVHYAGYSEKISEVKAFCQKHSLILIEDAAQAIGSFSEEEKPLGSYGDLAIFSFHESKNISSGEGGMLVVNRPEWVRKARIIREKGTNRFELFENLVPFYEWQEIGSAYQPSELQAAFLLAQLEALDQITESRKVRWKQYDQILRPLSEEGKLALLPEEYGRLANGSIYLLVCKNKDERDSLQHFLKAKEISTAIHYVALHTSAYFRKNFGLLRLPNAEKFSDGILRLPLYPDLSSEDVTYIAQTIKEFYQRNI